MNILSISQKSDKKSRVWWRSAAIRAFGTMLGVWLAGSVHAQMIGLDTTNTTDAILKMPSFREGLFWTGNTEPTISENRELLEVLNHLDQPWWTAGLEQFFERSSPFAVGYFLTT